MPFVSKSPGRAPSPTSNLPLPSPRRTMTSILISLTAQMSTDAPKEVAGDAATDSKTPRDTTWINTIFFVCTMLAISFGITLPWFKIGHVMDRMKMQHELARRAVAPPHYPPPRYSPPLGNHEAAIPLRTMPRVGEENQGSSTRARQQEQGDNGGQRAEVQVPAAHVIV